MFFNLRNGNEPLTLSIGSFEGGGPLVHLVCFVRHWEEVSPLVQTVYPVRSAREKR